MSRVSTSDATSSRRDSPPPPPIPRVRPPSPGVVATLALATLAACVDVAAPVRRAVRPALIRPLHIDSIAAPARVVAGDSLPVTLHGACHGREVVEMNWPSDPDYPITIWVYDVPDRPPRDGCAPLVVAIPTIAPLPGLAPPPGPVQMRVAVRRPRGEPLVRTATLVLPDSTRARGDSAVDQGRARGNVPPCPATPASATCSTPSTPRVGSSPPR